MTYIKAFSLGTALFLLEACAPSTVPENQGGYYFQNIYFGGHLSKHNKHGIKGGCKTSKGVYTKNHWLFYHSHDYNEGWFSGRDKCLNLLKIDEEGDLIL